MVNDLPLELRNQEMERERNAYNAAFYELGFRWHWDRATYEELQRHSAQGERRVRHYLETRQAHLLKAYDVEFLVDVIQERMDANRQRWADSGCVGLHQFNWAEANGSQLGA